MTASQNYEHLRLTEATANYTLLGGASKITDIVRDNHLFMENRATKDFNVSNFPIAMLPKENNLFVFTETAKNELAEKKKSIEAAKSCADHYTLAEIYSPNDKKFEAVDSTFKKYENIMSLYLKICREEKELPEEILTDFFNKHRVTCRLSFKIQNFKPQFSYSNTSNYFGDICDELVYKLLLIPLFKEYGALWIKNKLCNECGKVFFYKSAKAAFCSDACKMRSVRKNKA